MRNRREVELGAARTVRVVAGHGHTGLDTGRGNERAGHEKWGAGGIGGGRGSRVEFSENSKTPI